MRIVKYIALTLFAFFWLAGCSSGLARWLFEKNLIEDDYRYGDLYRMSNLSQFKELREECRIPEVKKMAKTHLVLAGDSFTEEGRIEPEYLTAEKFSRIRVDGSTPVNLEKSDRNILVIETVERHVRERFASQWRGVLVNASNKDRVLPWYKKVLDLRMPYSTERHEAVLFGYDWVMKIREIKASLNYQLFGRVDEHVALSQNEEHLLYYLAVKPGISSAFDEISDQEIKQLVTVINEAGDYYMREGFDEVIIIPIQASILGTDLGSYYQLVRRIQQNKDLKVNVLDVYSPFMEMSSAAYAKGDTHWSCEGQTVWIEKLNFLLNQFQESRDSTKEEVL